MHQFRCCCALALTLLCAAPRAQLLIGQTVGVTGAVAATVKESMAGASLYIDSVNARGGISGEKISIITLDDKFDVKQAAENARVLIEEKKVLALFMNRGTPHTQAMLPLLAQYDVALIAPSTGAMLLHQPVIRQIFNVRSSYQREAQKAVQHLATVGISRIAVVHVDDSFGLDGLAGTLSGLEKAKLKPVALLKFDRDKPDYSAVVPELLKADAQTVVWIGSGTAVSNGVKALRAAGSTVQVVTLSNNASVGFIKSLGDTSRGVIITQVLPSERAYNYAFVKEANDLARSHKDLELSPAVLEGFASAKVLVEALRRASPKPTREKIIAALEGMNRFDIGGLAVSYSATDHTGLDFADLSIVGGDGKFKR
jgi:ABC-type branched-subunit amino acid transport system substrate-binding protein